MTPDDWPQAILDHVGHENYRPVKPRIIAKQLDIARDQVQDFKRVIKRLVKAGKLSYGANHLIAPPDAAPVKQVPAHYITGTFRRMEAGFGFVRPKGSAGQGRENDLYIAAEDSLDAATGDTVLVRPKKADTGGRFRGLRGAIVEILVRETHQFVGTYIEKAGQAFVQVDGGVFAQPILVGDPGAKSAQPEDKVVFEMIRFPTQAHGGEGVISEVLGSRGQPGVDTLSIIREYNLPDVFGEDVLEAARHEAEQFDETQLGTRLDLSAETIITIDPVDARDFDDAISLVKHDNGHWLLGVHIADVSHFVRPGGALDREAHHRATSVYLPDRVIPMLPEIISNGLASLQPDRVRFAKTAFLEFTADGIRVATDLKNTAIVSKRRFAYEEVDDYLAHPEAWKSKLTPEVHALVGRMHELAMILRERRMRRGSLELSMSEVKVDLDKSGRVAGAHRVVNTVSHQIIEEFMLAANDAVAETLAENDMKFLRRVHNSPDPRKLKALTEFVTGLGFDVPSLESRFALQALLTEVAGQPAAYAVNYAVLRSLQRAVYSPEEEGHFALASDCYCHFTSPIRRYPDLHIHRLVDALTAKKKPKGDMVELSVLGEHCSMRERRAEDAERELKKIKLLDYFSSRIGQEMDAVITGVESFGLFAQGVELPVEGLIHVNSLVDDYYQYDKTTHSLTGRREGNAFRLGDPLRVKVARVDIDRRELDFRIVGRETRSARTERPQRTPKVGGQRKPPKGKHSGGRAKPKKGGKR